VARWRSGQCADGSVVAIDTDTRYCGEPVRNNLQWRTDDVRSVNLPAGSFDLVHSRLTFCHLPEREAMGRHGGPVAGARRLAGHR
jgi:hypothetical protein